MYQKQKLVKGRKREPLGSVAEGKDLEAAFYEKY